MKNYMCLIIIKHIASNVLSSPLYPTKEWRSHGSDFVELCSEKILAAACSRRDQKVTLETLMNI